MQHKKEVNGDEIFREREEVNMTIKADIGVIPATAKKCYDDSKENEEMKTSFPKLDCA